jgi:hypothetical protein
LTSHHVRRILSGDLVQEVRHSISHVGLLSISRQVRYQSQGKLRNRHTAPVSTNWRDTSNGRIAA